MKPFGPGSAAGHWDAGIAASVLALLVGLLVSGCGHRAEAPAAEEPKAESLPVPVKVATTTLGVISDAAVVSGTVVAQPDREATVNPGIAGKVTSVLVRPGERVAKGQPVVLLDPTKLESALRQAQSAVAVARAQEAQSALEVLSLEQAHANSVRQASEGVRAAELALEKLRAGARPQEVAQAQAAVAQAEATRNNARSARDRSQALLKLGLVSRKEFEDAETQMKVTESQFASAREQLSLVQAGVRPQEIEGTRVQVQQAKLALEQAQAGGVDVRAKREALQALKDQVSQARAVVRAASADLALASIRAPIAGTVVQRPVSPGASVDTATVLLTVADLSQVEFLAQLQPRDLSRVRVGQPATLSVPAYPGRNWTGSVAQISTATDAKTNTVPARLRFANPGGLLKGDMVGTVHLRLARRQSLRVPKSAVLTEDGKSVSFVVDAKGVAHRREVRTGLSTESEVEVLSGLSAGQKVVTTGNYGLVDGAKTRVLP
ncbi:MAG TPA: efflux RND transporter periplasmic adaptor subunit [Armatimonadota bacterium]